MSKLSPALKSLISAPHARPNITVPPSTITSLLSDLAKDASKHNVGIPAWLTFSTATAMTMNSPGTLTSIWSEAQKSSPQGSPTSSPVTAAELVREVALKCIAFNGIPRSINCMGAFHASLPSDVTSKLSTTATRGFTKENIDERMKDGLALWDSVYAGFERKLIDKLAQSHPDLPVHILCSHYSGGLSNPSRKSYVDGQEGRAKEAQVGRVLTSLVAVACLRSQTGVGPQVTSHIFGLRKAYEKPETGAEADGEVEVQGGEWLAGEQGNTWLLEWVDRLIGGIGTAQEGQTGEVTGTFAPGRAKL